MRLAGNMLVLSARDVRSQGAGRRPAGNSVKTAFIRRPNAKRTIPERQSAGRRDFSANSNPRSSCAIGPD